MLPYLVISGVVLGGFALFMSSGFMFVKHNTCRVVERFGEFQSIKQAGLRYRIPLIDRVKRTVGFEMQNLPTTVRTKLSDNAFVAVEFVQQYWVSKDEKTVQKLVYELGANYEDRIAERVHNEARSVLNRLDLNDVYDKKDEIGHDVEVELKKWLVQYGIELEKTLTNDVNPADNVIRSMNEKKQAEFDLQTAELIAEAEYKKTVRAAEARREGKIADGEGIAGQRNAIFSNISDTVIAMDKAFDGEVPVTTILHHVLELQRLDTQEQIAKNSSTTTLFVPYRGGTDNDDVGEQILRGNLAADRTRELSLNTASEEDVEVVEDNDKDGHVAA
jgi:regulator of protease activity HflC (stomatin/prohibitin superfamily)